MGPGFPVANIVSNGDSGGDRGVDELCASGGRLSKARKAQRSKEIKHSHGSDAPISSGTASGIRPPHQIVDLVGPGFPDANWRALGVPGRGQGVWGWREAP